MATKEELAEFFEQDFPQANFIIERVGDRSATIRKKITHEHLRPGGTVSGPVLMEMADAALYVAILSEIGLVALAVTTNLNINFMRKPASDKDVIAECKLMKLGKLLAIGEVSLFSDGDPNPVAHAVGTYAIPPVKKFG
ncbi:PaaI family thioesterase [Microbulbifer elongatus]|uniref:PaaI family thioesterase n=1 Tax=Microbulbifer elongatus TaxID=86173 RepID=A0ABT1P181_9GAMM|nr:PaaI family thioesterase [Microbulbifer elongatus]MCQ3829848.1 PaaI family thioesterase [Microbulbifer elongatus]